MDLLTSHWRAVIAYATEDTDPPEFVPVRISVGAPRWVPWAKHVPRVNELMPFGLLSKKKPLPAKEFDERYEARLDRAGVEVIQSRFDAIHEEYLKPLVLLCWEPPGERCHRRHFAAWWEAQTGQAVPEVAGLDPASLTSTLKQR